MTRVVTVTMTAVEMTARQAGTGIVTVSANANGPRIVIAGMIDETRTAAVDETGMTDGDRREEPQLLPTSRSGLLADDLW